MYGMTEKEVLIVRDIVLKTRNKSLSERIYLVQDNMRSTLNLKKSTAYEEILEIAYLIGCIDSVENDLYVQPLSPRRD